MAAADPDSDPEVHIHLIFQPYGPYICDESRCAQDRADNIVSIMIGIREIKCKLEILQRTTNYFKNGVPGMVFSLPECFVSVEAFQLLYRWMDQPSYVFPPELLMTTYRSAKHLRISALVRQFEELFCNPRLAREEIGFYMFCGLHLLMRVSSMPLDFPKMLRINRYFLTMISTKEYLTLLPQVLMGVLNSPMICVNSEMEVLIAIIIWLFHDYDSRSIHTFNMLSCVRFDCIPSEAIVELREHPSFRTLAVLFNRPEFEMFLQKAPPLGQNTRLCNRRIWIYDKLCNYHHDAHCLRRNFITFNQMMNYKHALRRAPKLHWWHRLQLDPYVRTCRNELCKK
ncbi:uncharacterized protein LOC133848027 [Drosophila sulfurigaster albostrigata]|uniref:uncharacterized protein LOC133848027 n=1 Tax=Drosophila sulfurigaster albostrigata TaxID=89887 RepID=UPI002D21E60A|nr:uncharacterized protein LOC133848027 [Drosophila sulfurigaster albostrigata]